MADIDAEIYVIVVLSKTSDVIQVFAATDRRSLDHSVDGWLRHHGETTRSLAGYCRENDLLCTGKFRIPDTGEVAVPNAPTYEKGES